MTGQLRVGTVGVSGRVPVGLADSGTLEGAHRGPDRVTFSVLGLYIVISSLVPYEYGPYLVGALASALAVAVLARRVFPPTVVLWTLVLVGLGVVGALIGTANGNPGAGPTLTIFVFEPLILGLLLGAIGEARGWQPSLVRIMDCALVAAATLGVLIFVSDRTGFTLPGALVDPRYTAVDFGSGGIRTNFQGYNNFVFLAPYGILRFFRSAIPTGILWRAVVLVAAVSAVLLSGRRVLYLTVPIAITFALIAFRPPVTPPTGKRKFGGRLGSLVLGSGLLVVVMQQSGVHLLDAIVRSLSQVTLTQGDDIRGTQSTLLLSYWGESPLWGHGSGAVLPDYVRNTESPWSFELSYHLLLVNFGLIGLMVLGAWGAWVGIRLYRGARAGHEIAQLMFAGWLGTIMALIVDPYVFKIDGMWMLFIPFGVAAARLCDASPSELRLR